MMKNLIIIGASGHGKVVADIAEKVGYNKIAFLDDNVKINKCSRYFVVGTIKDSVNYKDYDFIVAIGDSNVRQKIQYYLEELGLNIATLIHPNSVIAKDVKIEKGTVVVAGAVINPNTTIGKGCIINTCSSIDHDCIIGDFVHISVDAHIAGTVRIGHKSCVGAGAIVINNVEIESDCVIGAGAVVIKNIVESGIYVGVPAKKYLKKVKN